MSLAFASGAQVLTSQGQISAAQLNTLTSSAATALSLIAAPGAGLIIRPLRVQLIFLAQPTGGAAPTVCANTGHFNLQLNSTTPNVIAGGGTITALCSPAGGTALPDTFFTGNTSLANNTSKTADFMVSSLTSSTGAPSAYATPVNGANSALVLASTNTVSATANMTLFWNISYQIVPVNPY